MFTGTYAPPHAIGPALAAWCLPLTMHVFRIACDSGFLVAGRFRPVDVEFLRFKAKLVLLEAHKSSLGWSQMQ